jgi:hypothetical protein
MEPQINLAQVFSFHFTENLHFLYLRLLLLITFDTNFVRLLNTHYFDFLFSYSNSTNFVDKIKRINSFKGQIVCAATVALFYRSNLVLVGSSYY